MKPLATKYKLLLVGAFAILAFLLLYPVFFIKLFSGPSFIEEVIADKILSDDIKDVYILRQESSASWPFKKEAYDRKKRIKISQKKDIDSLYRLLKYSAYQGHKKENHPISLYRGIIEVVSRKDNVYYLLFSLHQGARTQYVSINSNASDETNPNAGEWFWSVPLSEYLKVHDPWYKQQEAGR